MPVLVIHAGYGKTATTFLQDRIFPNLEDVLYLGKSSGNSYINENFRDNYTRLFYQSVTDTPEQGSETDAVTEILGNRIIRMLDTDDRDILLLSDENLLDFANYDARTNLIRLKQLFGYISRYANEKLDIRLMMTIRNQKDALKSYFAFDYPHLKSRFSDFSQFLEYGLEHPIESVFAGYHYHSVFCDIQNTLSDCDIRFFVYERMTEDSRRYITDILEFIGSNADISNINVSERINPNPGADGYLIRNIDNPVYVRLLQAILKYIKSVYRRYRNIFGFLKDVPFMKDLLAKVTYLQRNRIVVTSADKIDSFPQKYADAIDHMYSSENERLSEVLNIDLEKYGYIRNCQ